MIRPCATRSAASPRRAPRSTASLRHSARPAAVRNVYAADGANMLTARARLPARSSTYPTAMSNTVDVIDQRTYKVIDHFAVGALPQHVTPSWDFRTLYVDNDLGNSLTPIDPRTGKPRGAPIPVSPTRTTSTSRPTAASRSSSPSGCQRLDFRDAHTMKLVKSVPVPCSGVDHMDFTADGRLLLASCEFSGQMVVVDVAHQKVVRTIVDCRAAARRCHRTSSSAPTAAASTSPT